MRIITDKAGERLDIYVNRAPLALDIADRRADNDRETAVKDTEIRAYLAQRWSRRRPSGWPALVEIQLQRQRFRAPCLQELFKLRRGANVSEAQS